MSLADSVLAGDRRAVARAITLVENGTPEGLALLRAIYARTGRAHVIGVTGPPGVGKSTLVDAVATAVRRDGQTVGVIAVDPTSPFSGGAFLGDRVRMQRGVVDPGVFIRSLATRGRLGGLSAAARDVIHVLDASGRDVILVETVGAGQAEVEVMELAHTTVVVLAPGLGDEIQAIKAGILEIGDVFVVNKADREGADRAVAELRFMIDMGRWREGAPGPWLRPDEVKAGHEPGAVSTGVRAGGTGAAAGGGGAPGDGTGAGPAGWTPPVIKTVARDGEGVGELVEAFRAHRWHLARTGGLEARRQRDAEAEVREVLLARLVAAIAGDERIQRLHGDLVRRVAARELDPHSAAEALLEAVRTERS